jgi:hypothetical protein
MMPKQHVNGGIQQATELRDLIPKEELQMDDPDSGITLRRSLKLWE